MLLLRALSPQGDVDFFSLLKSGSVVRAAEIAYLVEYFDRHVGRSRRGRRGAAPFADLDHDALVELIGSNTDEASLRRLKLHVVRLLAVENATTLTPRCFKMGGGLLKGAMLSALGLFFRAAFTILEYSGSSVASSVFILSYGLMSPVIARKSAAEVASRATGWVGLYLKSARLSL